MRAFIFFLLSIFTLRPASAELITLSINGFIESCNAPCVVGQIAPISATINTSVAGSNPNVYGDTYLDAVTELTIGSVHLSSLNESRVILTNDFYNNVAFIDQIYIDFSTDQYSGLILFLNADFISPSSFLTSSSIPNGLAVTDLTNYFAGVYLRSDNSVVESVGQDNLAPSVPEPSTWAMLLMGFVASGFMRYRTRKDSLTRNIVAD
jgi:hypothetical protein